MRLKFIVGIRPGEEGEPVGRVFVRVVQWPMRVPSTKKAAPNERQDLIELRDAEALEEWAEAYFGRGSWDVFTKGITPGMIEAAGV